MSQTATPPAPSQTPAQVLASLTKTVADLSAKVDQATNTRVTGAQPAPIGMQNLASVNARKGENTLTSRGFSFGKLFAMMKGFIKPDENSVELQLHNRLIDPTLQLPRAHPEKGMLAPLCGELFHEAFTDKVFRDEVKSMLAAGCPNPDPDEMSWISRKAYGMKATSAQSPAQSWIDQSLGGSLVPPAAYGQPIELLRNKEALMNAGATIAPLGPNGRLILPRLTSATTATFSAENTAVTGTTVGTGALELQAKKVIALVYLPNEFFRYASPAGEALIRNDLFKTVALTADKDFLDGPGSNTRIRGIVTICAGGADGTNTITPTNSNQLSPQDWYEFQSAIEENNGTATGYIMRPKMLYAAQKSRWTPYSGGTSLGGFVFNYDRSIGDAAHREIAGLPVTATPQVSNTRGSGAQTYVLCADWPDVYIGMFGAIEFATSTEGANLMSSDQTLIRAILSCDMGIRHPGVVSFCDSLNFTVAG